MGYWRPWPIEGRPFQRISDRIVRFTQCVLAHDTYCIHKHVWLLVYLPEKYEFVSWDDDIPNIRGNKIHVPNHQADVAGWVSNIWFQRTHLSTGPVNSWGGFSATSFSASDLQIWVSAGGCLHGLTRRTASTMKLFVACRIIAPIGAELHTRKLYKHIWCEKKWKKMSV